MILIGTNEEYFSESMISDDGKVVRMTPDQANAMKRLIESRRGGIAKVFGYVPTSDWKRSPVQNISMITKFSLVKLYERKIAALKAITYDMAIEEAIDNEPKLKDLDPKERVELFNARKAQEIESLQKSLNGERDDAHRQAHDTFYARFKGIKVNLVSQTTYNGKKELKTNKDGHYFVKSIMIPYIPVETETVTEGERKVVNSGNSVRMKNIINRFLNSNSIDYRTLSLKEDNFDKLVLDRKHFLPEHVTSLGDLLEE